MAHQKLKIKKLYKKNKNVNYIKLPKATKLDSILVVVSMYIPNINIKSLS